MRHHALLLARTLLVPAAFLLPSTLPAQLPPIGLTTTGGQWFDNDDPTSAASDVQDQFGWAVAAGDFNGDGADDLATGVPLDEGPDGEVDAGSVAVRYGVRGGGLATGPLPTILRETAVDSLPVEHFGHALAAADFNGDGFDDLAVGVPYNDSRGAVYVYYGTPIGLQLDGLEIFDETVSPEPTHMCAGAQFGAALAAGNFDGDPYADLAIGAPYACERIGGDLVHGGAVFVAHGQDFGLLPFFGYRISQDSVFIEEEVEEPDYFGNAVAAGDFNQDGYDDLAIGVQGEGGSTDHGAVQIVMGSPWGLLYANNVIWLPGALGEVAEKGDRLGDSLASGDFDGDGFDDLAIGIPFEDLGTNGVYVDTGSIAIAYGAADPMWFDLSRTDHIWQSSIYGDEAHDGVGDRFGWAFAAGDFDGDGFDDLAIGAWDDDWSGIDLGAVHVLTGTLLGLGASSRFYLIGVGWEGVPGNAGQTGQYSGWALASGDFDGNQHADLVIGVPRYDKPGEINAGGEAVLYGSSLNALLSDGFELGSFSRWSAKTP